MVDFAFRGNRVSGLWSVMASAAFTPSAAAYSAGDIFDIAKEFVFRYPDGTQVESGALVRVVTSIIKIDQTGLQASEGAYTLPLYTVTPPSGQADNDTWTLASADLPSYVGTLSLGTPVDLGAVCFIKTQFSDQQDFHLVGNSLFGRLITTPGFTPTAVARQVYLYGVV